MRGSLFLESLLLLWLFFTVNLSAVLGSNPGPHTQEATVLPFSHTGSFQVGLA